MKNHQSFFRSLRIVILLSCLFSIQLSFATSSTTEVIARVKPVPVNEQINAVKGLIARNLPQVTNRFVLKACAKENGADVFEVSNIQGKIQIAGSSGVAMSVGLNWYLRHVCNKHISWTGTNIALKTNEMKPVPGQKYRAVLPHQHNVYLNYCTLSYSMPWWDWERWQWEIDFMALNGINMPLGVVGIEAVWYNALLRVGFSDLEARKFLVAPNYFAWQWMQNIENSAEPLPMSWIKSHTLLAKQIINRQRQFGMTPIQQGFSGHVPSAFKTKFPEAKIRQQPKWCNFPGVFQVDPLDPLFTKFGRIFMEEEAKLFGLGGYYAADPFHESGPPADVPASQLTSYFNQVGQTIHEIFNSVDTTSTWVMQSWSIRKDIAVAAPLGRLLVIDLEGQKWKTTNGFWGHNFCVGQLHNFGNRINLHGDLRFLAANPFLEAKKIYPKTASGTGLFPEGITQNAIFYDLFFDVIWRNEAIDVDQWIQEYVVRRYGKSTPAAQKAWMQLKDGPYMKGTNKVESSSIIAARPALNCKKSGPNAGFNVPYKKIQLFYAWENLLKDKEQLKNSDGYQFDVMDVGRQTLSNLAQDVQAQIRVAFEQKDTALFTVKTRQFIAILNDVDQLCGTRSEYSFYKWVADATSWGADADEKRYFDKNASSLLTYWGPEGTPVIFDYSWREWSGLISQFYVPRWQQFFNYLQLKLQKAEEYSEKNLAQVHGREAWRANDFYSQLANWEEKWVATPKMITKGKQSKLNSVNLSYDLYNKWKNEITKMYNNEKVK